MSGMAISIVAYAQVNVAQVVQQRQELMEDQGRALFRQVNPMMRADDRQPWNQQTVVRVMTLVRDNAARIPALFPEGSGPQAGIETLALPTIWQRRAAFDDAARTLGERAGELLRLAQANDEAGFRREWATFVNETCIACHRQFGAPGVPGVPRQQ
jgi:cytochrome c556